MAQLYAKDVIIGDSFQASNYGLVIGFVENYDGDGESETGISVKTVEEFIGENPIPIYISQSYDSKLTIELNLVKDSCRYPDNEITEMDIRGILRSIYGKRGYQWMNILTEDIGEDISYRVRVTNVRYQRVQSKVVGITLDLECDSQFGYSREQIININATANTPFNIYTTSDDLNNYVYPELIIKPKTNGNLIITNTMDNDWITRINSVTGNEVLTMDCQREILTTSRVSHPKILNDFNLHWIRLLPEKNIFTSNIDVEIQFKFRNLRRVGFATT